MGGLRGLHLAWVWAASGQCAPEHMLAVRHRARDQLCRNPQLLAYTVAVHWRARQLVRQRLQVVVEAHEGGDGRPKAKVLDAREPAVQPSLRIRLTRAAHRGKRRR